MADIICNVAHGRQVELYNRVKDNDPSNAAFTVVLLQASEVDATLREYDDLETLLLAAGNTEATFTNYARIVLTDTDLTALPAADDVNDKRVFTLPDLVFTSAGGAANNTMTKLLFCYDSHAATSVDADIEPVFAFDYTETTSGSDLTITTAADMFTAQQQ